MNKEEFINKVEELGIKLTEEQLNQLSIYASYLIEYNNHTNLTTITDIEDIYLKHFYDSLTIKKMIDLNDYNSLLDVGTGAGFPGMVLKIVYPHLNIKLIESNNKKITFLNNLIEKCNLTNIECLNIRAEEYALNHLEEFDIVTSRAVANLRVLTELCLPFVKIGGYFVPLKANVEDEIKESEKILKTLNGRIIDRIEFNLPKEDAVRNILKIEHFGHTPKGYPRSYNKIKKG